MQRAHILSIDHIPIVPTYYPLIKSALTIVRKGKSNFRPVHFLDLHIIDVPAITKVGITIGIQSKPYLHLRVSCIFAQIDLTERPGAPLSLPVGYIFPGGSTIRGNVQIPSIVTRIHVKLVPECENGGNTGREIHGILLNRLSIPVRLVLIPRAVCKTVSRAPRILLRQGPVVTAHDPLPQSALEVVKKILKARLMG